MRHGPVVYRFGDFELHPDSARLLRAGLHVPLGNAPVAILTHLIVHAPAVVDREAIARAGWRGTASPSSVEKAISRLRQILDDGRDATCIETVPNREYRFTLAVEDVATRDRSLDDEPFRAFLTGRRELATLNRRAIGSARREFERAVEQVPGYAPAHVGLATACALMFAATRFDERCDLQTLACARDHARHATQLDPASAGAWSTLGFALSLLGDADAAAVAAWKAVALEPGSWRHALRLAYVSWGEERIEAAHRTLTLRPQLALAYWLKATVFIARGAFDTALLCLRDGCAAQDLLPADAVSYPAVGLHLLRGLVLAAQEQLDDAVREFEAELAQPSDQLYAQECSANSWYALGAVRLRQRDFAGADSAFRRALEIAPAHLFSLAALGRPLPALSQSDPRHTDLVIARAVAFARGNRHADAAQIYIEAIATGRAPNSGWILPVEPVLCAAMRPEVWGRALAMVQQRAT